MKIDLNVLCKKTVGAPLYKQLQELLRGAILAGIYKPGEKLESEREIIQQGGLSYPTVSRAIRELAIEGWLIRKVGSGTFISDKGNHKLHTIKRVAVFYYHTDTPYFLRLSRGLSLEAKKYGIEIVPIATGLSIEEEMKAFNQNFKDGHFDAVFGYPFSSMELNMYLSNLIQQGMPMIMLGNYFSQIACDTISFNDKNSGYQAAKHLISNGYRKLGYVCSKIRFPFNTVQTEVISGIKSAISEFPNCNIDSFEYEIPFDVDEKDQLVWNKLLDIVPDQGKTPFALICASDAIAQLVVNFLRHKNFQIPQNVSVIGAGNLDEYCIKQKPHLSTIEWPLERMGQEAIRLLVSKQHFTSRSTTKIVLDTKLIIRDSTGPVA